MTNSNRTVHANFAEDLRTELIVRLRSEGYTVGCTDLFDVARCWCNVRRRRIERRPRRLLHSRELSARTLPAQVARGLRRVEKVVVEGRNLNPHLSRKRLAADYSDALLDMWAIHHLHLGPPGGREAPGTPELLFAHVTEDTFYALDILDHSAFGAKDLALVLKRNWPQLVEKYSFDGILCPSEQEETDKERAKAWALGVTTFISLDGTVYGPWGGGRTSARTGAQDTSTVFALLNSVDRWQREAVSAVRSIASGGVRRLPEVVRLRLQVRGDHLRVIETTTGIQLFDAAL